MSIKKSFMYVFCFNFIISSSVFSMRSGVKVPYTAPSFVGSATSSAPVIETPQVKYNPELLKEIQAESESMAPVWTTQERFPFNQDLKNLPYQSIDQTVPQQKKRPMWASTGAFKATRPNLFYATSPQLMTRQQAASLLGVDQNATEQEIKVAHRKATLKAHPDTGGSDAAMKKVNEARDVLSGKSDKYSTSTGESDSNRNSNSRTWSSQDNEKKEEPPKEEPPIIQAARMGLKAILQAINKKVDLDAKSIYGSTALHEVIRRDSLGATDAVRALLDAKANPNIVDGSGYTPLMVASFGTNIDIIHALIKAGADVNGRNTRRSSPLLEAAINGRIKNIEILLNAGASLNLKFRSLNAALNYDIPDETILNAIIPRYSASFNDLEIIRFLLEQGANPNLKGLNYPLLSIVANSKPNSEVVAIVHALLEAKANPNQKDKDGNTPLLVIARKKDISTQDLQMTKSLIRAGADVNVQDKDGYTALYYVKNNPDFAKILIDAGARSM